MKKVITLLFALAAVYSVRSQSFLETVEGRTWSFPELRDAFEQYVETHGMPREAGLKPIARWIWYWDSRLDENGRFPDSGHDWDEWQHFRVKYGSGQGIQGQSVFNWKPLGPTTTPGGYRGLGRINCLAFHPTDTAVMFVGTPSGGVWKTTDGGNSWTPIADDWPSLGVSGIAIDPKHPDTMYFATGDGDFGSLWALTGNASGDNHSVGVLKSTDGGQTWTTTGLSWTTSQNKLMRDIIINPVNPSVLIASASDGIWRTADGGTTWSKVQAGNFKDLAFKPGDPNVVYATDYGSGAQVWRSLDGGQNWSQVTSLSGAKRIQLAVTAAAPNMVEFVAAKTNGGLLGLWASHDAGNTFTQVHPDTPNMLGYYSDGSGTGGQGWYDLCLAISPADSNLVFLGGVNCWKSTDGGHTWTTASMWTSGSSYNKNGSPVVHADKHFYAFHPVNVNNFYDCNDGGIYVTRDTGVHWKDLTNGMQISQFYKIGLSATDPNLLLGGMQDNGTRKMEGTGWFNATGGDGMECIIDYVNPNIMYSTTQYGKIHRSMDGFATWWNTVTISDSIPGKPSGWWVTPYVLNPLNPSTIYAGYKEVYKTTNRGDSWTQISNGFTGGTKLRHLAVTAADTQVIYAGTKYDLWRTADGGATWTKIRTSAQPVSYLMADPRDANTVWYTTSGYSAGNKVFYSTDGGTTWVNWSANLPNYPAHCIALDTNASGLYVGMEIGVFYRDMTMSNWASYSGGLPNAPLTELEISYLNSRVRAATFGRGVWESPLYTCDVSAGAQVTDVSCFGVHDGSVTAQPSGGTPPYTYLWSTGDTAQTLDSLPVGTYVVTVTDSKGCYFVKYAMVNQPSLLAVTINSSTNISGCYGDSTGTASADASGGTPPVTYHWSDGETGKSALHLPAGMHYVTVTDQNGCTAVDSVLITQPDPVGAILVTMQDASCFGAADGFLAVSGDGGTPGYSYSWSNGSVDSSLTGLAAGNYTVTVTDAHGCTGATSFTIGQPDSLQLTAQALDMPSCNGLQDGSISLSVQGGTAPYHYLWDNGDTTSVADSLAAGSYGVTVTDAHNCTDSTGFTLGEPDSLLTQTSSTPDENSQCNGTASVIVQGGTQPYAYLWSDPNGQTSGMAVNLCSGLYYVTVTDANSCARVDSVQVRDTVISGLKVPVFIRSFRVFPNPNDGNFTLQIETKRSFEAVLRITDMKGALVVSESWTVPAGQSQRNIDISRLAEGMYDITLLTGEGMIRKKVILQRP